MPRIWPRHALWRVALIAGGLTLGLSGCHLHHGYVGGGFGYHGGGYHGGHYRDRGHHYKRRGHHRRHGHGGRRGHRGWR